MGHLIVWSDVVKCKVSPSTLSLMQSQGYKVISSNTPPGDKVQLYIPDAGSSLKLVMSDITQEERDKLSEVLEINKDCLPKKSLPNQRVSVDF